MSGRRRSNLVLAAALALLAGCAGPTDQTIDLADQPAPRTTWVLRHRVVESKTLHVTSSSVSSFGESTGLGLGPGGGDDSCYVSVSAPGQGGPDNRVGEKVPTRFEGRPAVRDGAGSEGPYLMWQSDDGSWVEVGCEDAGPVDGVAAAVRLTSSSLALPFGVDSLPAGFRVAQIMQDRRENSTDVYVGRVDPQLGLPDGDLQISLVGKDRTDVPTGRAVTVSGLPALLDEQPTSPRVCLVVQSRHVCVGITPSDTGPHPDRSAEIPTLLAIAEQLRYAPDLDDRTTWFTADDVFG